MIKFLAQLIQSKKVKVTSGQRKSLLSLFSLALIMVQKLMSPLLWKQITLNLSIPPDSKSFNAIAFSNRFSEETKEFLLKYLINSPKYQFDTNNFLGVINSHCYQAAYLIQLKFQNRMLLIKDDIQKDKIGWTLNNSLKQQDFLQLKFWIAIKLIHCFNYKIINDLLLQKVEFGGCKNPIKATLLYIKFLQYIRSKFSIQNRRINQKIELTKNLCSNFIEAFDSQLTLRNMILQDDFEGKSVMLLMYSHSELLSKVEQIISQLWNGPYQAKQKSNQYRWTQNYLLFQKKEFTSQDLHPLTIFSNSTFTQSTPICNFYNFRQSVRMKYLFSQIFIFILTIILQYLTSQITDGDKQFNDALTTSQTNNTFQKDLPKLDQLARQQVNRFIYLGYIVLPLILTISLVQIIIDLSLSSLIKKPYNYVQCENMSMIIIFFCIIFIYLLVNNQIFWFVQDSSNDYIDVVVNIQQPSLSEIRLSYILAIITGLLWLRLTLSFRLTKTLGPLLKIIQSMTKQIMIFMLLQAIILLSFAEVGITLFFIPEFSNIWNALIVLISSALGSFQFQTFEPEGTIGKFYLIVFLIINLVLMLNLLIAILSQVYTIMEGQGVGLYLQGILDIYENWCYRKEFNALTFRNPPFNTVNLGFLCVGKKKKNQSLQTMSQKCEMLQYIPVMIVSLIGSLLINIFMIPLVCLKLIVKLFELKEGKFKAFMFIFFVYPLFAVFVIMKDMIVYMKNLLHKPECKVSDQLILMKKNIQYEDLVELLEFLKKQYHGVKKSKTVESADVILKFREVIGFTCKTADFLQIIQMVKSQENNLQNQNTKKLQNILANKCHQKSSNDNHRFISTQRFNLIKQFIIQNSFTDEESQSKINLLFPHQLIQSIKQCLISQKFKTLKAQFNKHATDNQQVQQVLIKKNQMSRISSSRFQSDGYMIQNSSTININESNLNMSQNFKSLKLKTSTVSRSGNISTKVTLHNITPQNSSEFKNQAIQQKMKKTDSTPISISCLSVGMMMRAQEQYYLENIDVGVMLKSYIDKQEAKKDDEDLRIEEQNKKAMLFEKRKTILKKFRTMRNQKALNGNLINSNAQRFNNLVEEQGNLQGA